MTLMTLFGYVIRFCYTHHIDKSHELLDTLHVKKMHFDAMKFNRFELCMLKMFFKHIIQMSNIIFTHQHKISYTIAV